MNIKEQMLKFTESLEPSIKTDFPISIFPKEIQSYFTDANSTLLPMKMYLIEI